jgi:LPS-assembly lipoprotein
MWSSNRRTFLLSAVALAGCGFTPAYGPNGGGQKLLGAILVDTPDTRDSYLLTRRIEERLGQGDAARFGLSYSLDFTEERMALTSANVTERYNVVGKATWALRDLATGAVLGSDTASNFAGYSTTGSTVATLAATRDARERLATMLADQIIVQLLALSPRLPA